MQQLLHCCQSRSIGGGNAQRTGRAKAQAHVSRLWHPLIQDATAAIRLPLALGIGENGKSLRVKIAVIPEWLGKTGAKAAGTTTGTAEERKFAKGTAEEMQNLFRLRLFRGSNVPIRTVPFFYPLQDNCAKGIALVAMNTKEFTRGKKDHDRCAKRARSSSTKNIKNSQIADASLLPVGVALPAGSKVFRPISKV